VRIPPFALERYFGLHEFRARRLLSSSDCETLAVSELLSLADDEALRLWRELRLGYTEARGHPLLREEVAALYPGFTPEEVLETVPEEGIFLAMHALLEPGDRVVATFPAYQSLHEIARAIGCHVSYWRPDEARGWRFDPDALEALLADGARLVVVNFPHNPTGATLDEAGWRRVLELVRAAGARLFSDEMYRFLGPDPRCHAAEDERSIVLGGLSKAFGLPGLRVGWLASRDQAFLRGCAELKDYTTICGSGPSEILGLVALRARERIIARNVGLVARNLEAFDAFLAAVPGLFAWSKPAAGSIGLARYCRPEPASRLCERLVREAGLMLVPSTFFGDDGDRHVRIGLGRADLPEALDELRAWLGRGG
jgi:aspartate/methionine/tyrosine aminotransferase